MNDTKEHMSQMTYERYSLNKKIVPISNISFRLSVERSLTPIQLYSFISPFFDLIISPPILLFLWLSN